MLTISLIVFTDKFKDHVQIPSVKTWERVPNNIEIRPNFTYPVSRGLETGLAAAKAPHLIKLLFNTFLHLFLNKNLSEKNQEFVPQVLKQVFVDLSRDDLGCW